MNRTHVVVLVPGIMGSVLKLAGEVIWPGPVSSLIFPYKRMAELMSPDVVAVDCIRSFVRPVYQSLIDDMEACGFCEANGTFVVAPYDWRRSIDIGAIELGRRLAEIVQREGADVELSIVAHSMGGLVARFFLESGRFDAAPGFKNVARLITLGTPHRGAPVALPLVLGQEKRLFLSPAQVRHLASDIRYPSAYQLLPRMGEPIAWDWTDNNAAAGSAPLELLDCYSPDLAGKLGLVRTNLDAAVAFHAALDSGSRPKHVRYFCFLGNRQNTATHVLITPRQAKWVLRSVEQDGGGDGTVPIWSGTLPGLQFYYVAGEHSSIFTTRELRTLLGRLLGRPSILSLGTAVEIALKAPVVEPDADVQAALKFSLHTTQLKGEIRVVRLVLDEKGKVEHAVPEATYPIQYSGPDMEEFHVVFRSPAMHGHYLVSYVDAHSREPTSSIELIVQLPDN